MCTFPVSAVPKRIQLFLAAFLLLTALPLTHVNAFMNEIKGKVRDGERFRQPFGPGFEFVLEPNPAGWEIVIREHGREENLARLTPPLHFAPNPREIEAWHLVAAPPSCPRPYGAETCPPFPHSLENLFSHRKWAEASLDRMHGGRSVQKTLKQCGALGMVSSLLSGSKSVTMLRGVPVSKFLNSKYDLKGDIN